MSFFTQQMLDEAQQAYHELMTGRGVVELRDQNGETVRYSRADKAALRSYILEIKADLGLLTPGTTAPGRAWF